MKIAAYNVSGANGRLPVLLRSLYPYVTFYTFWDPVLASGWRTQAWTGRCGAGKSPAITS